MERPMTYAKHPMTEAQLQAMDAGYPEVAGQCRTLAEYERKPDTADMLCKVRGMRTRERWGEIAAKYDLASEEEERLIRLVWNTMGGETCLADAARLIARKV